MSFRPAHVGGIYSLSEASLTPPHRPLPSSHHHTPSLHSTSFHITEFLDGVNPVPQGRGEGGRKGGQHYLSASKLVCRCITESVDSVCRDGTDMPYVQYKQKPGKLKNTAISFQRYLTFITECSVTNQTLKVARNHRGGIYQTGSQPFFLEKAYLMTALSSNCTFSTKGQHFLAHKSTVPPCVRVWLRETT